MDNLKEFKAFLKTIPSIKEDVLNHRYTWQEIYEIYTMYGEDDHFFRPYKEHPIENMNVLEIIKNVDLEALSSSLQSIEKVLGIVSNLSEKYDDLLDEIHQKKQSTVLEKLERISILMSMLEMLQ